MRLSFSDDAWEQYLVWQERDRRVVKRINLLIRDIRRDPHSGDGLGKPELLSGLMSGWASRRIDDEHRLVYRVRGEVIEISSCFGHY